MSALRNPAFYASVAVILAAIGVPLEHGQVETVLEGLAAIVGLIGLITSFLGRGGG